MKRVKDLLAGQVKNGGLDQNSTSGREHRPPRPGGKPANRKEDHPGTREVRPPRHSRGRSSGSNRYRDVLVNGTDSMNTAARQQRHRQGDDTPSSSGLVSQAPQARPAVGGRAIRAELPSKSGQAPPPIPLPGASKRKRRAEGGQPAGAWQQVKHKNNSEGGNPALVAAVSAGARDGDRHRVGQSSGPPNARGPRRPNRPTEDLRQLPPPEPGDKHDDAPPPASRYPRPWTWTAWKEWMRRCWDRTRWKNKKAINTALRLREQEPNNRGIDWSNCATAFEDKGAIYGIYHFTAGKWYVGQTVGTIAQRAMGHWWSRLTANDAFHQAMALTTTRSASSPCR